MALPWVGFSIALGGPSACLGRASRLPCAHCQSWSDGVPGLQLPMASESPRSWPSPGDWAGSVPRPRAPCVPQSTPCAPSGHLRRCGRRAGCGGRPAPGPEAIGGHRRCGRRAGCGGRLVLGSWAICVGGHSLLMTTQGHGRGDLPEVRPRGPNPHLGVAIPARLSVGTFTAVSDIYLSIWTSYWLATGAPSTGP